MRRNTSILIFIAALVLILTPACALGNLVARDEPPPATPTRTPKPTFTPTPPETPTPAIAPTNTATPEPTATETPVETPTPEVPPTDTPEPTPEIARLVINNPTLNVRGGPGTNYAVVGRANNGERYDVTGKNSQGTWYQINFNGQNGWVAGEFVGLEGDPGSVQVAANIPAAPVQPTRPPAPTAAPVPTSPPAPTQPPAPRYEFNIALVQACQPQQAGNYINGTVYKNGQPFNGAKVVFSYAPDGPWVTTPQTSGPHPGYENWNPGYYSHIVNANGAQAGNWFVWIVNEQGTRISETANWQSTGPGEGCNQATVDFDSR